MAEGMPTHVIKECACGRTFSSESWSALTLIGTMDNGRDAGELFELRQCPCGTTLTLPIGEHAPSIPSIRLWGKGPE